jgi:hypothetical protein
MHNRVLMAAIVDYVVVLYFSVYKNLYIVLVVHRRFQVRFIVSNHYNCYAASKYMLTLRILAYTQSPGWRCSRHKAG